MIPTEQSYLGIPGYIIFWLLFVLVLVLFGRRAYQLWGFIRMGRPDSRYGSWGRRLGTMLGYVFLQKCSLRRVNPRDRAGLGHLLVFWGFMFFLLSYLIYIFLGDAFGLAPAIRNTVFSTYYSLVLDAAGLLVLAAILWAAVRRYIIRPPRLEATAEAGIILALITLLMLSHFSIEGFLLNLEPSLSWTPIRQAAASLFSGLSLAAQANLYTGIWWFHYAMILGFLVFIPYSKHMHIMASPFNVLFRNLGPRGALVPIDLEKAESFGVDSLEKFTWKQLLDGYACTQCGRCQAACPAWNSGKPLNPKKVTVDLKEHLLEVGSSLKAKKGSDSHPDMVSQVITEEVIWECTTCRACQEECPVLIEHIQKLVDMRRHLVLERAAVPETALNALKSLEARGHPWRGTTATRTDWAKGLGVKVLALPGPEGLAEAREVDILYWVGCTAALEERNMRVAAALAQVLQRAGVNFGILGAEETCCGEPARRLGNEYLFQMLAQNNIATFKNYGVKRIITSCPHCFNTIKNEYPQFGGEFEVIHHSQFLAQLLAQGRLQVVSGPMRRVTYHDSCYLGRYNDIYDPPRQLLGSLPGLKLTEMGRRRQQGFCCGGGGGRLWQEETIGQRINHLRTQEAIDTGAQVVASACPYCLQMFEDGLKAKNAEESVKALDLAELLAAATSGRA